MMIDVIWLALRIGLAAVLLVSAVGKLRDANRFAADVSRYDLLPSAAVRPAAVLLTAIEILTVGLLSAGVYVGFWLASGLFVLYASAIASALGRHLAIPCGCFGGDEAISPIALVRVGLFLAGSLTGLALGLMSPDRWFGGWDPLMAATLAVGGLIFGRLVLLVPDVRLALGLAGSTDDSMLAPGPTQKEYV